MAKANEVSRYINLPSLKARFKETCWAEFIDDCIAVYQKTSSEDREQLFQRMRYDGDASAQNALFHVLAVLLISNMLRKNKHIADQDRDDLLQEGLCELARKMHSAKSSLASLKAEIYRIADELPLTPKEAKHNCQTIAIADWLSNHEIEVYQSTVGEMAFDLERVVETANLSEIFDAMLSSLKPREADTIRRRFGLAPYREEQTFQEIADIYHLQPGRIQQIEAKALRKLRHPSRLKYLDSYYNNRGENNSRGEIISVTEDALFVIRHLVNSSLATAIDNEGKHYPAWSTLWLATFIPKAIEMEQTMLPGNEWRVKEYLKWERRYREKATTFTDGSYAKHLVLQAEQIIETAKSRIQTCLDS